MTLWRRALFAAAVVSLLAVPAGPAPLPRAIDLGFGQVAALAFSPSGDYMVAGGQHGEVRIVETREWSVVSEFTHGDWINAVAVSCDGLVAASTQNPDIALWSIPEHRSRRPLHIPLQGDYVRALAFSHDGGILATGDVFQLHGVRLWSPVDRTEIWSSDWYGNAVLSLAFSPGDTVLAAGFGLYARDTPGFDLYGGDVIRLFDTTTWSLLHALRYENSWDEQVFAVAFSPDGATLASASRDGKIRLWRVADGALEEVLVGHTAGANSVAFSPDGEFLASGSSDGTVRLWAVAAGGSPVATLPCSDGVVYCVAFSPTEPILAAATSSGTILIWDVRDLVSITE